MAPSPGHAWKEKVKTLRATQQRARARSRHLVTCTEMSNERAEPETPAPLSATPDAHALQEPCVGRELRRLRRPRPASN